MNMFSLRVFVPQTEHKWCCCVGVGGLVDHYGLVSGKPGTPEGPILFYEGGGSNLGFSQIYYQL